MQAYQVYQKNSIAEASQEDIMLLLMKGVITRLNHARTCWQNQEETRARELRTQALNIICELDDSLDKENGPADIVEGLIELYGFMEREIMASAPADDFDRLETVQELMQTIYNGFAEAVAEYQKSGQNNHQMPFTAPQNDNPRLAASSI